MIFYNFIKFGLLLDLYNLTMKIEDLPSIEELQLKIDIKYANLELSSKSPEVHQQKIRKIKKDLKEFMKNSSTLIEKEDQTLISSGFRRIQLFSAGLLFPSLYIALKIGTKRYNGFLQLSFPNRTLIRIGVVGIPIGVAYYYSYYLNERLSLYIEEKYADRVQQYLITKDPKVINSKS